MCPSRKLQLTSVLALPVSHISPRHSSHPRRLRALQPHTPISDLPSFYQLPKTYPHAHFPRACQLGEFELTTPAAYHFCFVGCATHFSLAAQSDGQTLPRCDAVVGISSKRDTKGPAIFKFGAPPTAGTQPYPEYTISDRSLYVKMEASTSISAEMKGPEMTIHAPEIVRICLMFSVHVASGHFLIFSVLSTCTR